MQKLNVTFCSYPDFSSNARPLYKYMKKRYKNQMNFTWIVRTDDMFNKLNKIGIHVLKINTQEYFNYILKSNIIFSTHGDLIQDKPNKCIYIDLWHGIVCKKSGFILDKISNEEKDWCTKFSKKVDYMIVPSEFWAILFASIFKIDKEQILELGYPKFDEFTKPNALKKLSKVLNQDLTKYSKIILYAPTFKSGVGRLDESDKNQSNIIDLKEYDNIKMLTYLKKKNYLLCIKMHPSEECVYKDNIDKENIKIIKSKRLQELDITLNEILDATDVLVSDYSSLIVEYTFLKKPVICINTSLDIYSKNRGIVYNDYDFWTTGLSANDFNGFIKCIDTAFSTNINENDLYNNKRHLWLDNCKNGGCKKICDYIFDGCKISDRVRYHEDIVQKYKTIIKDQNSKIDSSLKTISSQKLIITQQSEQLNNIVNSKRWKFINFISKFK